MRHWADVVAYVGGYSVPVPGAITPTPESWVWFLVGQPGNVHTVTVIHERNEMRRHKAGKASSQQVDKDKDNG